MSQAASSKGRENVSKQKSYATLNLNQTFVGSKAETKTSTGVQRHGLQTLGKIGLTRRPPPPANLPSLKKENLGNDPSVNLVPSGKSGWGKKEKEAKQQQQQLQQQQQQTEQQPSPSIQTPAKTSPPEEVSLRPNAGAVPSQSENKKSWNSAKLPTSSGIVTGTTPPPSTYFQREFPTLAGDGGQGKLQREDGAEGENSRNAGDVGSRHPFPPEDYPHHQDGREPRQMYNGNPAMQQHMRPPFYPQQPYGEQYGPPPAMYPINRGMPGFPPPMHPGGYPFPIPGSRKDQMLPFDQRFMRMPMHGGQPPFPPQEELNSAGDKQPSAKRSNVTHQDQTDSNRGGHLDWANAQDEVDYNAKLKFDESDGEDSPRSSPKPKSSNDKSKKDKSSHSKEKNSGDKEPLTSKSSGDGNQQQRENWAEMYPGYQGGAVPMPYPQKWGMGGFVPAYDPRHPMPVPHPYHQYPPNWFFVQQQAQMRMNHPISNNESPDAKDSQGRATPDEVDISHDQHSEANTSRQKDKQSLQSETEEKDKKNKRSDAGATHRSRDRSDSDNDPSRRPASSQYRLQEQSFSKSSGELPPRFRNKNQQKPSPSADHPNKSITSEEASANSLEKPLTNQADDSVRKIIKRKDSTRSDDGASVASQESSERPLPPSSKEGRSQNHQNDDRSGSKFKSAHKTDHKDSGSSRSANDSKKSGARQERNSTQGKSSAMKPNNQEKNKSNNKGKSLKEGMKKLEKPKTKSSTPSAKPQTPASNNRTRENEAGKSNTVTAVPTKELEHQTPEQRKTAWATVVTGEPANTAAVSANTTKKSLLDIQKEEQDLKDKEELSKGKDTTKRSDDIRVEDIDQVSDKYEKQPYRGRDKFDNRTGKPFNDRRYPEDRKRKYDADTQREHSNRNYNNRRDNDRGEYNQKDNDRNDHTRKDYDRRDNHDRRGNHDRKDYDRRDIDRIDNDRHYDNRQQSRHGTYNNNQVDKQDSRFNSSRSRRPNYDDRSKRDESRRTHKSNKVVENDSSKNDKTAGVSVEKEEAEVTSSTVAVDKSTDQKVKSTDPDTEKVENKENIIPEKTDEVNKPKTIESKDGTTEQNKVKHDQSDHNKRDAQSTRRKDSEKYSRDNSRYQSKYDDGSYKNHSKYDDKRKVRTNERQQQQRANDRRRDQDEKHPDRPLYSSRGRGRGRGASRDTRSRTYPTNNGKYNSTKEEDNEKSKEESADANTETNETEKKSTASAITVKPKHTEWGQYSDTDHSDYESCSDTDGHHNKPNSIRGKHPMRGRGRGIANQSKRYENKHHEETTAPRFQRNDVPGRGRGRYQKRGTNKVNGSYNSNVTMARGRSPKGGPKHFNNRDSGTGTVPSSKTNNDESSDNSADYHSAGETAMSPESTCDDEVKSPIRRSDQDRSSQGNRGARHPSRGKGKPGHFLAHRQQAGGRLNEPSVSGDAPPAASSLPSNGNKTEENSSKSKKENNQSDEAGENKKAIKNLKPAPIKVDLFSTYDVRNIAGVVCIDDHPINDEFLSLSRDDGEDDDNDDFVEVTYKRGGQKEIREKTKKDTRKKSKDEMAKPAKIPKQDIAKNAAPKTGKPTTKANQESSRVSPVMQPMALPNTSSSQNQTVQNSNAAMAAVGEWEPAKSLMRSTGNPSNTDQPQLPTNPLTPPPGNAWQRPLSFAGSQQAPDPKAVGSGKPKPQAITSVSNQSQQPLEPKAAKFDVQGNTESKMKQSTDQNAVDSTQSQPTSQHKTTNRSSTKEKIDRPKRESRTSTKGQVQKRDLKKVSERRVPSEKAPRFQKDNKGKPFRKDSGHGKNDKSKPTNTETDATELPPKEEERKPVIVHEASVKISRSKMVDSAFADVPLETQSDTSNPLVNSLPSPSKISTTTKPYSDEDAQNAKDTARSVINSLGDDDERNLETKSLPGTPPLAVEIPEPTLSGPSSDPGRKGTHGSRSMAHEFTELSLKLLSTKVKEVWDNPINGPQVSSHSWSEPAAESVVFSSTTSQSISTQDGSDPTKPETRKDNKRDDNVPLQRSQDVFSSKRMGSDAQNVCKVKPRQQQSDNESKATVEASYSQHLLATHRPGNHMMNFQGGPRDQKAAMASQFVNPTDHRITQVVQPTVMQQNEHDYNEAFHHHQGINLQQIPGAPNHLHASSSANLPSQDGLQQRLVMNNVYGQPGISLPQNQMIAAPWQVVSNQTQSSANPSYRSQVHPSGTMFGASPVSLPNSAVYMSYDPQAANNAQVQQQQQGGSSQVQHQVGIMLPRQGPHHSGSYINIQGQQYQVRPQMVGNLGDIPHSDNSSLINHVHAKPFKPQTGAMMPGGTVVSQHIMHNQLVASVRPRPMTSRSLSSGASPPIQIHDQTRLSSPPMDPNIQYVAAGMPIKGHHMLPHNAQLPQHLGGQIPPQMFRQQQSANAYIQRGPPGPINPRYQRPMPGPIQRPGTAAVHLSSQIVGAPRPRQSLPFQATPIPQNPIYSKAQQITEAMANVGGFRDLQHQKMIADTQKFFKHAEPVIRRPVMADRSPNSDLEDRKITSPQMIIPPHEVVLNSPTSIISETQMKTAEENTIDLQESVTASTRSTKEPSSPIKMNSEMDLSSPVAKDSPVMIPLNVPTVDQSL